jgi:hypothetical protein
MDKWRLISESVMVTRIDIHLTGERTWPTHRTCALRVLRMTTVYEVSTKLNSGIYSWDEVLAPSNARPGRHSGLPHPPSNKPPRSREGRFNEVATGLLGLSGPMKPDMRSVQIKVCCQGQNDTVLNWHNQELPHRNLGIATVLSPPFPSECSTDAPTCAARSSNRIMKASTHHNQDIILVQEKRGPICE